MMMARPITCPMAPELKSGTIASIAADKQTGKEYPADAADSSQDHQLQRFDQHVFSHKSAQVEEGPHQASGYGRHAAGHGTGNARDTVNVDSLQGCALDVLRHGLHLEAILGAPGEPNDDCQQHDRI